MGYPRRLQTAPSHTVPRGQQLSWQQTEPGSQHVVPNEQQTAFSGQHVPTPQHVERAGQQVCTPQHSVGL